MAVAGVGLGWQLRGGGGRRPLGGEPKSRQVHIRVFVFFLGLGIFCLANLQNKRSGIEIEN